MIVIILMKYELEHSLGIKLKKIANLFTLFGVLILFIKLTLHKGCVVHKIVNFSLKKTY